MNHVSRFCLTHDAPPVPHHGSEALAEAAELVGLAAVEGHALGVLAEADEAKAEVGFVSLLVEAQPDQGASDPVGEPGADDGVDESRPHHVARHSDGGATQVDRERSRELPEDHHEGDQRHHRPHAADGEREGAGDEQANILRDALVGVVGLTRPELHPVVGAVGQPRPEIPVGEPAPPADLEHLVEVELVDSDDHVGAREHREPDDLVNEDRVVLVLQRVVEGVVPLVEEDVDVDDPEIEHDDDEEQAQGRPAVLRPPVRTSNGPGIAKQAAQASHGGSPSSS